MGILRWYKCLECGESSESHKTMGDIMVALLRSTIHLSSQDWSSLSYTMRDEWDVMSDFIVNHEGHDIAYIADDGEKGEDRIGYIACAFREERGAVVRAVRAGLINEAEGRKMLRINHVDFGRLLEGAVIK